jgi:hypothetical protein
MLSYHLTIGFTSDLTGANESFSEAFNASESVKEILVSVA